MLNVDNNTVINYINSMNVRLKDAKTAPLQFDKFISKTLHHLFNVEKPKYPMVIRIPKSIPELLEGDFTPAKEIVINSPIRTEDGTPIWFGDSTQGIDLLFGYKNGDSRYISDMALDDKNVHMLIGGSTGSGKSVTVNTTIFGMLLKYAPWSLKLVMSDAKIVEFKRYAREDKVPHVTSIAATQDTDYTISLLESVFQEMQSMNSVYGKVGQSNIQGFKKKTGLEIPQTVIIIEEFQYMFTKAGKKAGKVKDLLDGFTRLGRSAGYHLMFASQGLGSDFPKDTLNNINIRGALACKKSVSEVILGNDEAGTLKQKGRLIINTNPDGASKEENSMYRVPFQSDKLFEQQTVELNKVGKQYDFIRPLDFYDEQSIYRYNEYKKLLSGFQTDSRVLYLGEPSFVIPDEDKIVKLKFTGDDIENILVYCKDNNNIARYGLMLKANMEKLRGSVSNTILNIDQYFEREYKFSEIATSSPNGVPNSFVIKSVEDVHYMRYIQSVYTRKLIYEMDTHAFEGTIPITDEQIASIEPLFHKFFPKDGNFSTVLNKKRFFIAWNLLGSDEYVKVFGNTPNTLSEDNPRYQTVVGCVRWCCTSSNLSNTRVTLDKFPPQYIWLVGLQRLLGIGRDSKASHIQLLKRALLDCSEYNIRFIAFTTTMEDMTELRVGFKYCILDGLNTSEAMKVKCEDYPEDRASILGVLFDATNVSVYKFKKLLLEGETIQ